VPSVGTFFTRLHLEDAFKYQDQRRFISRRRFVAPSFNDIRLILNSAQLQGLVRSSEVQLVTFDGDVTLYDDGACLTADNPVIQRILRLLKQGRKVGIVTAAGYEEAPKYYGRLQGLLDAVHASTSLTPSQKQGIIVMGGESNFLFRFDSDSDVRLTYVPREEWLLDEMRAWRDDDIKELLDLAESALRACATNLSLPAAVLRKDRAVGVYPVNGVRINREQLEETVLVVQNTVERSAVGSRLPFCAFNGKPFFKRPFLSWRIASLTLTSQAEMMSLSILATSPGVFEPASGTLAVSIRPRRCTLVINSCPRVPMISRYAFEHRYQSGTFYSDYLNVLLGTTGVDNCLDCQSRRDGGSLG
jgi:IMP and pyridine-specific 5'-nucleotidase